MLSKLMPIKLQYLVINYLSIKFIPVKLQPIKVNIHIDIWTPPQLPFLRFPYS